MKNNNREIDLATNQDEWLEIIMEHYGERLTKLSYNYLKDWNLAEDVVQDVFITCYQQHDRIHRITSFKSWIYRITINRCKDVLKSASFKKVMINSSLFQLFTSKDLTPELAMIKRSEEEELSLCVLALPVKYREVMILHYYEGLAIQDIQEILKLNQNTVKTRLNRGREKLKNLIERSENRGGKA